MRKKNTIQTQKTQRRYTSQDKTQQEQDMRQNEAKYKPTTEELIKSNFFNDKKVYRISANEETIYRFALDTELEKLDVVGLKRL